MLQIEDQKQTLRAIEPDLKDLASALGVEEMKKEIAELDHQSTDFNYSIFKGICSILSSSTGNI